MRVGSALRELAVFLEACEKHEQTVASVDIEGEAGTEGGELSATVDLVLSAGSGGEGGRIDVQDVAITREGRVRLAFESVDTAVPVDEHDVDVEPLETRVTADGTIRMTLAASVGSEGPDAEATTATASSADEGADGGRDRDLPPFEDTELLRDVYESRDTFAEMADALEMDVTAETVRRYMIDHGIHQPNTYDTGEDDELQAAAVADGIGLPEDVTVEGFIETVQRSNTIYEVKEEIGADRKDTLEMLRELNLLDLVAGRLAIEAEREIGREEIIERLREAADNTRAV